MAFVYSPGMELIKAPVYDPVVEYARMGIPNQQWRLSTINETFEVGELI